MKKDKHAQRLGRLGGLKGGYARAEALSKERRSEIAKLAAQQRWSKKSQEEPTMLKWSKRLTDSDAQQETGGSKMPFLRFTSGNQSVDYETWFRNVFFAGANWHTVGQNPLKEEATIQIDVTILGNNLGAKQMRLDHKPGRFHNHKAPTTHLHYDNATRNVLENMSLTGCVVEVTNDNGHYILKIGQ